MPNRARTRCSELSRSCDRDCDVAKSAPAVEVVDGGGSSGGGGGGGDMAFDGVVVVVVVVLSTSDTPQPRGG